MGGHRQIFVQYKKTSPDAIVPTYKDGSCNEFDLYSLSDAKVTSFYVAYIRTGIKLDVPEGYEIELTPGEYFSNDTSITFIGDKICIDQSKKSEIYIPVAISHSSQIDGLISATLPAGSKIAKGVIRPIYRAIFQEEGAYDKWEVM